MRYDDKSRAVRQAAALRFEAKQIESQAMRAQHPWALQRRADALYERAESELARVGLDSVGNPLQVEVDHA